MSGCVIFGGSGYIGTRLADHLLMHGRFSWVHLADIRPPSRPLDARITYAAIDVRKAIPVDLTSEPPQWIFNLAAVHREPGHADQEYFDTNLSGAENVCGYASVTRCRNVYFTSSISVYGPTQGATSEASAIRPNSPYGGSKLPAEWIHRAWREGSSERRLIICRPGVVYGPGDPGNILRMIRAIKRGYFAFPGSPEIYKAYAYIYGMLDSVDFTMDCTDPLIVYNYVESPTEPLGAIVEQTKRFLDSKAPVLRIPKALLLPVAVTVSLALGKKSPIHPVRVRKAAMSTHIVPGWLQGNGFRFKYSFVNSLQHWRSVAPEDFE